MNIPTPNSHNCHNKANNKETRKNYLKGKLYDLIKIVLNWNVVIIGFGLNFTCWFFSSEANMSDNLGD
jgi:hypothetical protein